MPPRQPRERTVDELDQDVALEELEPPESEPEVVDASDETVDAQSSSQLAVQVEGVGFLKDATKGCPAS